jgi:hypothetical protein
MQGKKNVPWKKKLNKIFNKLKIIRISLNEAATPSGGQFRFPVGGNRVGISNKYN